MRQGVGERLVARAARLLDEAGTELRLEGGLFVVLRGDEGEPLGAVGTTAPSGDLRGLVRELVIQAATVDPRFPPIQPSELDGLRLELWLLAPPREVRGEGEVDPSRDALRIRRDLFGGTLLPDVAAERGWDAATALAYACRKAGLSARSWRDPGTEVLAFRATLLAEPRAPAEGASPLSP